MEVTALNIQVTYRRHEGDLPSVTRTLCFARPR